MPEYNNGLRDTGCGMRDTGYAKREMGYGIRNPLPVTQFPKYKERYPLPFTRNPNRGFTLTEILLVAALLSVLGLSVYSAFNNGIKIWKRVVKNVIEEDISIFFEKISRDLRNSFQYSLMEFEGAQQRIAFPTLIVSKSSKYEIGYVAYFEDSIDNSINRQQQNYSQLYKGINPTPSKLVKNIENLTFQYYYYDAERDETSWESSWEDKENLPLAVRVKVEFYEDNEEKSLVKSISVPVCEMLPGSKAE